MSVPPPVPPLPPGRPFQHGHTPGPVPPRAKGVNPGVIIAGVGCGCLTILTVIVLIMAFTGVAMFRAAGELPKPATTTSTPKPKVYDATERAAYQPMVDHVDELMKKYQELQRSGQLWTVAPHGKDTDPEYQRAFVFMLTDMRAALRFGAVGESTDVVELDEMIAGYRVRVDQIEADFLAGRPLKPPHLQEVDKEVILTAEPKTAPPPPKEPTDPKQLALAREKRIAAFQAQPDATGSYRQAGEQLAAIYGMRVDYTWENLYRACRSGGRIDYAVAAYCSASPDVTYINTKKSSYPRYYSDPRYIDTIRHEIAHRRIHERCGTTSPPIAGRIYEGVTNSYAVKYLGANRERLQDNDPAHPEYRMSEATDRIAEQIAQGKCS